MEYWAAMLILALDTTSERGGVALHRDLECLAAAENAGGTSYSVSLFEMTQQALAAAGAALADVALFAVATGPGSFTGIRVGVAAAQGWAQALGRPAAGVSVLEALVEEARPDADWALLMSTCFRLACAWDTAARACSSRACASWTLSALLCALSRAEASFCCTK